MVSFWGTNEDVDHGEAGNGPVSAEIGVGEESADQWSDVTSPAPSGDGVGRGDVVHAQTLLQVVHQIRAHPIVSQPLTALVSYTVQFFWFKTQYIYIYIQIVFVIVNYVPRMKRQAFHFPVLCLLAGFFLMSKVPSLV